MTKKAKGLAAAVIIFGVVTSGLLSQASISGESSYELSCRAKAKELAADSYRNCVSENRNAEIEKIKKEYQERLRTLKEDYEKEVEKLGGKRSAKKPESAQKLLAAAKVGKKSNSESGAAMNVESHPNISHGLSDDSMMDLPEPIPVESPLRD